MKLEPTKSHFIVVNGNVDDKESLNISGMNISCKNNLTLLGSHISSSGNVNDDLRLHLQERFRACLKYFNFIKSNRYAPIFVKLKVLKACVMSNLLYNCETFGAELLPDFEKLYFKLIKVALGVRPNIPNELILIELGLLPLKVLVYSRQLKFFQKFKCNLKPDSSRDVVFKKLLLHNCPKYLKHYVELEQKYSNPNEIYFDFLNQVKRKIIEKASNRRCYKFQIYLEFNPLLEPFKNINDARRITESIVKFRVGSHYLPIETGRWSRKPREERLCAKCNVLGDEKHLLFHCADIDRSNLVIQYPPSFIDFLYLDAIYELFSRIVDHGGYIYSTFCNVLLLFLYIF